jgi:Zn-finger in ubiquitin-hydrolases and other protein
MTMAVCTHLDQVKLTEPAGPVQGCQEGLKTGGWWVQLRMCQTCGRIGYDSSPNQHASRHALADGHPIVRSVEPGEDWSWCYVDQIAFILNTATNNQEGSRP